ncbi:MAG: MCP four helix bundle domain-containing protein [Clostridiaceae bacterium]|nr:MCP four helix bundle domain-containing protein [Clostridiaceae bacterium]
MKTITKKKRKSSLKVSVKLTMSYLILIMFMGAIGYIEIYNLNKVNSSTKEMYNVREISNY